MHLIDPAGLEHFIHDFGYAAVFLVIAIESAGVPLPGEATLVSAAIYAAATHALSLPLIILAGASAAIVGDNVGFWIGRRFGFGLLLRYGGRIGLDEKRLKLGQYLFARHGGVIVFFGRFIAVLRAFAAILAGANRFPWPEFLMFNAAGGIVWASLYATGAYWFGRSIHKIAGPVGITLLVAALVGGFFAWRFLKRHEAALMVAAEQAMPGPLTAIR